MRKYDRSTHRERSVSTAPWILAFGEAPFLTIATDCFYLCADLLADQCEVRIGVHELTLSELSQALNARASAQGRERGALATR
jgi:hypothetical protein